MLGLCYYGDPALRKTAQPVEKFDAEFAALVEGMVEAMHREDGVGLAAPQVGVALRLIVIDTTHGEEKPFVLANPEITALSDEKVEGDEGCLSLPGITLAVERAARVSVRAQDEKGESYVIEGADGLLARALQHENDHLNGILLIDHASPVQRGLLRGKLKKISQGRHE